MLVSLFLAGVIFFTVGALTSGLVFPLLDPIITPFYVAIPATYLELSTFFNTLITCGITVLAVRFFKSLY